MKDFNYKWTCPMCGTAMYLHFIKEVDADDAKSSAIIECNYCKLKSALQYKDGKLMVYIRFEPLLALEETDDDRIY